MIFLTNLIQILDKKNFHCYNGGMYRDIEKIVIEKIFTTNTMYSEQGASTKRKDRERWALVFKYEGETRYTQGEKQFISNKKQAVLLPMGSSYEWRCTQTGHFCLVEFACPLRLEEIYPLRVPNSEELLRNFKKLEYKRVLQNPFYTMECIRDLYNLILSLVESTKKEYVSMSKAQKLLPAVEFMATHYAEEIYNDDLAMLTGLSTVYFRKLFKGAYGSSPMEYLKRLRIEKAKEMLGGDFGSITDIAISLGYASLYDFSRDFKTHVGVPPSKYLSFPT